MSPRDHLPRLDGAQLAATVLESVFYGIYFVLLIQCAEALIYRAKVRGESMLRPMPITAVVLFVTITAHWILDLMLTFEAFIQPTDPGYCVTPAGLNPAEKVYLNLPDIKNVLTSVFYVLTTLVGDGFMIYRLYIVWSRNYFIIIPPVIMCISLAITGGVVTYLFSQATTPLFQAAGAWITSSFVLTFVCNLYSTGLIAFKIFRSNRHFGRASNDYGSGVNKVMEILVESAVLYGLCITLALGTYVGDSNIQFTIVAVNGPVIGIIFCMIVARAHRTVNSTSHQASTNKSRQISHALRPMAVKITTHVEGSIDASTPKTATFGTPPVSSGIYQTDLHSSEDSVEKEEV
ncbi:hypothetical protein LshimejAT787_0700560 [Lyophyllum shimeji]|uniref:Uncharacterized protein n=1 Tax=Lyophyllum shimeji TaxID=47721 RepID=A0A9P3PPS8_LYOSH|nr:hypothetical protein LshimejAT787_0700560 [Lyophyllum shimeji]